MFKAIDKWLPGYLASVLARPRWRGGVRHLFLCLADHYEPFRGGAGAAAARRQVADWVRRYREVTREFRDADGRPPRHTFFYPAEDYDAGVMDDLARLGGEGRGEVEIHLHHRHDTPDGFRAKLETFRDQLHRGHGLLGNERGAGAANGGPARYGFIHGNWALCNSRPDGDWCGVNDELGILSATGCYADFTFPSAPSPTQPRTVNAIYRAVDTPGRPRACDRGIRVACDGGTPPASRSGLMLIQGPLALNWRWRKWGVLPRVENGELTGANPPTPGRVRLWAGQGIGVLGRPDWVFVKLHTHGCVPANQGMLLGPAMHTFHTFLGAACNDGTTWCLHYVTARELYNLARAAEEGWRGAPHEALDHAIGPPEACRA